MFETKGKSSLQAAGPSLTRPSRKARDVGQVGCFRQSTRFFSASTGSFFSQRATSCSMKVEGFRCWPD